MLLFFYYLLNISITERDLYHALFCISVKNNGLKKYERCSNEGKNIYAFVYFRGH